MRSERSRKSRIKKEDYSVEFIGGSGQKRGVNMNTAMQPFGYGLAALLFCIAILGVCHNMTLRSKGGVTQYFRFDIM